jgi:hypothetical protein
MTDTEVDVLALRWYVDRRREPDDLPQRWLDTARAHLPAALPRRFGDGEPLRGRLDRDGDDAFVAAYATADMLLAHSGTAPTLGGTLGTPTVRSRLGPMTSHSLDVRLDAAEDPAVRAFFAAFADAAATVYASASIRRGLVWTGRTLYSQGPDDAEPYLAPLGQWLGLPPRAPVWAWFGEDYRRLVRMPTGVLHVDPATWIDPRLAARLDEDEPSRRVAQRVPRALRTRLRDLLFPR